MINETALVIFKRGEATSAISGYEGEPYFSSF
jgi:hypothetical protein